MNNKKGFILYTDYYQYFKELTDEELGEVFRAVFEYQRGGEIKIFKQKYMHFLFILIKNNLDRDNDKYDKMCERNRQNAIKRWDTKIQKTKKTEPKMPNMEFKDAIDEVIDYLNEKTGKKYKSDTKKTITLLNSLFNKGYKIEDIKKVIDKKTADWMNTDFEKYLRPETLFKMNKFEGYIAGNGSTKTAHKVSFKDEEVSKEDKEIYEYNWLEEEE